MRFSGKTVLVAGGSRGIGAAIVDRLASEGACVMIGYNASGDAAAALNDRLKQSGAIVETAQCDVSDAGQVDSLVAETLSRFGQIDILCSNSGIVGPMMSIAETDIADFDQCIATNLRGMFLVNRAVLKHMLARKAGRIINTASIFGKRGWANYGTYCATKAGVIAMTQSIALEVANSGITANCVCPGATASDMMTYETQYWADKAGVSFDEMTAEWLKLVPLGRFQEPAEQASLVAFLASEEARYITGVAISCAGGMEVM